LDAWQSAAIEIAKWSTPVLVEIQACLVPAPATAIQVNNYDLALGMMAAGSKHVSWRDKIET
jgi:hypothetical protein